MTLQRELQKAFRNPWPYNRDFKKTAENSGHGITRELQKMQVFSSEKSQQVRYCFSDGPEPIDLPFNWLIADKLPSFS